MTMKDLWNDRVFQYANLLNIDFYEAAAKLRSLPFRNVLLGIDISDRAKSCPRDAIEERTPRVFFEIANARDVISVVLINAALRTSPPLSFVTIARVASTHGSVRRGRRG